MEQITESEKKALYAIVRAKTGFPTDHGLSDDTLDALLVAAVEDITQKIQNWLIEQQWVSLQSLGLKTADITFAMTTKTLDFEESFTHAYSKQVGLGNGAPSEWELKKDYIITSADTQVYTIPANREVNEVLWFTPPDLTQGGSGLGFSEDLSISPIGGGFFGMMYGGVPGQYMQPAYTLLLSANDRSMKNRILRSELTYRITAGPNGTKHLWLYPVPGSSLEISGSMGRHLEGSKVWYYYYDANAGGRNKCLEENSDIIRLPSDVPVRKLTYKLLNDNYKVLTRQLLTAEAKIALGNRRGKFSGKISAGEAELIMDYGMLHTQGETEKQAVFQLISESLEKITLKTLMADRAEIAENLTRILKNIPFQAPIMFG